MGRHDMPQERVIFRDVKSWSQLSVSEENLAEAIVIPIRAMAAGSGMCREVRNIGLKPVLMGDVVGKFSTGLLCGVSQLQVVAVGPLLADPEGGFPDHGEEASVVPYCKEGGDRYSILAPMSLSSSRAFAACFRLPRQ